jgi:hypothetical protein
MKSVSTTDMNPSGIDTTRLPGSTSEQYRRKASGMVIPSGPWTKKCGQVGYACCSPVLDAIELIGIRTAAQADVDPLTALKRAFDRAGVVDATGKVFEAGTEQRAGPLDVARQQPYFKPVAE